MSKPFRRQLPGVFRRYIPHLNTQILYRLTGDLHSRGINYYDASLIQYFPKEQQLPLWKLVKKVREPVIRFHLIRRIMVRMKMELELAAGIINDPPQSELPTEEEVEQILSNII